MKLESTYAIQLTIDRIKTKYLNQLDKKDKNNFEENLKVINNQIKQIENLVNEFSDLQECQNQY